MNDPLTKKVVSMNKLIWLAVIALIVTSYSSMAEEKALESEVIGERDTRMEWWREARFGMGPI